MVPVREGEPLQRPERRVNRGSGVADGMSLYYILPREAATCANGAAGEALGSAPELWVHASQQIDDGQLNFFVTVIEKAQSPCSNLRSQELALDICGHGQA